MFIINEDILALSGKIKKLAFSDRKDKAFEYTKITARPFATKQGIKWQLEKHKNNQVFHENLSEKDFLLWCEDTGKSAFKQACLTAEGTTVQYTIFPDKIKRKVTGNDIKNAPPAKHNKEKNYILPQGQNIPALVDLGVFGKDFMVVASKYDKYKQINRFIEIVDDAFSQYGKDEVTILDFGCGKSYLTFIIYYHIRSIVA